MSSYFICASLLSNQFLFCWFGVLYKEYPITLYLLSIRPIPHSWPNSVPLLAQLHKSGCSNKQTLQVRMFSYLWLISHPPPLSISRVWQKFWEPWLHLFLLLFLDIPAEKYLAPSDELILRAAFNQISFSRWHMNWNLLSWT